LKSEELESKIERIPFSGCWLWTGALVSGYGQKTENGKQQYTHRLSWELHRGHIPDGLYVLHRCDVRCCVNPDHLFLGTYSDNTLDAVAKGRWANSKKTHCPKGHPYDDVNTTRSGGRRHCRACNNQRGRDARAN